MVDLIRISKPLFYWGLSEEHKKELIDHSVSIFLEPSITSKEFLDESVLQYIVFVIDNK